MIPIKRLDHISMAAPDWRKQSALLEQLLGFKFLYGFEASAAVDFDGCVSQVRGTEIEFEVISPAGSNSFVQKYIDERGPGLHHITLEVHDLDAAVAAMEAEGIKPFGGISEDGMWRMTYIHPKDSGGILWQLFVPIRSLPRDVDRNAGGGAVGLQRLDHVSMAVPDLDRQSEWLSRILGFEEEHRWSEDQLAYDGAIMKIPGSLLQFEIIAPTTPESFVQKFIDKNRPGMHHICCEVASVEAAAAALRPEGIEAFGGVIDNGWKRHTFIHPRDSGGVLFQLVEEPPSTG